MTNTPDPAEKDVWLRLVVVTRAKKKKSRNVATCALW
jgi:hypothetical protein